VIRIILAVQGVVLAGLLLLAADIYAHKRVEMVGGFNIWGYRGAVVKQRAPGDARVLLLGGTRAYGYGASADDTIAHALEWELTVQTQRRTTVINAAHMGATASDYATMVDRHADLDPDVIVLYDDLGYAATRPRRSSVASAFNGYEPILPIVLEEKGMFLRQRASVVSRSLGWVFQTIGRGLKNVESSEAPLNPGDYAALMIAAAERALPHAIVLIVVDPPQHAVQHQHLQELRDRLAERGDPRLELRQLPEVANPSELLDGYSYGGAARGRVMRAILPELLALSQNQKSGDDQLIRAARDRSNAAIAKHDLDGIAAAWMEDVHVVSSTSAQTAGKRANRDRMAAQFTNRPDTIYVRTPVTIDVYAPWNVASERGEWTGRWTEPDGALEIGGTYQAQWRKVDGRWLIQGELFVPTHCKGSKYCSQRP
jgi:ketosteroid isomerase-like protein